MRLSGSLLPSVLTAMFVLAPAASAQDATSSALLDQFETVSGHVLNAAEQVPEGDYGYQPTEEVRTFGEMVDHVADAHFGYCGALGGDAPAAAGSDASTKSEIVERYRASRDFCLDVYRQAGSADLQETISVFGGEDSRVGVLVQNVTHDNLHYGNIVTYMRSLGMVPPSSQ